MARRPRGRIISVFQDFATIYIYNNRENYITSMIVFFFRLHIPLTHPRTDGTAPRRRHRDGRRFEKNIFVQVRRMYLSESQPTVPGARIRDFPAAPRLPALLRSRRPAPQLRPCRRRARRHPARRRPPHPHAGEPSRRRAVRAGRRSVRLNRRGRAYYEEGVRRILLDMPHERGRNAEGPFERSLSKVTDDREAVSQVMHEEPFHFVRTHPGSDPVDRPHQFPESMQRPRLVGFPELAESENVNEVAPPHRNCLQPGPVGSRWHSLLPGEGRRPLSFTPPAMSAREAAPETGA